MPLHVIVKGKDIIWEQMQGHNSQISYARQTKHVKDKQKQTESSFSQVSVSPLSKNLSPTHCSQLFRVQWGLLVWFLVCFIDPGIRAVHALCPLPIDHSPLLLTDSPVEKKTVQRQSITAACYWQYRCRRARTFCPGYDPPLCEALYQTCCTVWSLTHTYPQYWWI